MACKRGDASESGSIRRRLEDASIAASLAAYVIVAALYPWIVPANWNTGPFIHQWMQHSGVIGRDANPEWGADPIYEIIVIDTSDPEPTEGREVSLPLDRPGRRSRPITTNEAQR